MKKIVIRHEISASGHDEGHTLVLYRYDVAHGWAFRNLTLSELAEIRDEITRYLAEQPPELA